MTEAAVAANEDEDALLWALAEIERLRAVLEDCIYGRKDWMEKAKAALETRNGRRE